MPGERDTAIIDSDAIKAYLGPDFSSDSTYDVLLAAIAKRASELVSGYCERAFVQATYTDHLVDSRGGSILYLHHWPVTAVASLKQDTARKWGSGTALTEDTSSTWGDFKVLPGEDGMGRLLRTSGRWVRGRAVYLATYTAGYELASVPQRVTHACLREAARMFEIARTGMHVSTRQATGVGGATMEIVDHAMLGKDTERMLKPFRRRKW